MGWIFLCLCIWKWFRYGSECKFPSVVIVCHGKRWKAEAISAVVINWLCEKPAGDWYGGRRDGGRKMRGGGDRGEANVRGNVDGHWFSPVWAGEWRPSVAPPDFRLSVGTEGELLFSSSSSLFSVCHLLSFNFRPLSFFFPSYLSPPHVLSTFLLTFRPFCPSSLQ